MYTLLSQHTKPKIRFIMNITRRKWQKVERINKWNTFDQRENISDKKNCIYSVTKIWNGTLY